MNTAEVMEEPTRSTVGAGSPTATAPARPRLSVVMPAYNEEGAIADAVGEVRRFVLDAVPDSELVVVDDGSRDGTGRILDGLAADDPRIRPVHKRNGGHGPALLTGVAHARGENVFVLDSDRQIPLDGFAQFWTRLQGGCDAVFGVRRGRHDPRLRLVLTRVVRWSLLLLFGVRLHDANVPFKLFRRSLWDEARALIPDDTLAPSLFFALYASRTGRDIAQIDVTHRERSTGVVSIRRWKLLKFCAKAFGQMCRFRGGLRRSLRQGTVRAS